MRGISVVINTFNEESNIANVIASTSTWVDEIIVVDMYSTDKTVQIAESLGAKVYMYQNVGYADPARQFAIEKAQFEWILMLDADEMVPIKLSKVLQRIMNSNTYDIVNIPWTNYLFGKEIKFTGWGEHQDAHMRFLKKDLFYLMETSTSFFTPQLMPKFCLFLLDKA